MTPEMNPDWKSHLATAGYSFDASGVNQLSQTDVPAQLLVPLSHYALIKVSGSDARQFLQNQLSNDVNDVSETHSQLSSYSSPKGMMYSNFRVLQRGDAYYLRLPAELADKVTKRLRMFVLRDDVRLEWDSELVALGLAGLETAELLAKAGLPAPQAIDDIAAEGAIQVIRTLSAEGEERFGILLPASDADAVWNQLVAAGATPADTNAWLVKQISAGEGVITEATSEHFVAQMLNLDLIGGINFKKGCYPGQEYIAKTQYRGKLRSRLHLIRIATEQLIPPGTHLIEPEHPEDESVGTVIQSASLGEYQLALAVLRLRQADKPLAAAGIEGAVEVLPLPYPFPA